MKIIVCFVFGVKIIKIQKISTVFVYKLEHIVQLAHSDGDRKAHYFWKPGEGRRSRKSRGRHSGDWKQVLTQLGMSLRILASDMPILQNLKEEKGIEHDASLGQ